MSSAYRPYKSFFFWQDETLFASPKKVRPGEEDAFAAALSERSRRRSSPGGKKSPAKSEEPEMIQVITKDLIRRLRLVSVLVSCVIYIWTFK